MQGNQEATPGAILLSAVQAYLQSLSKAAQGGSFTIEPSLTGQFSYCCRYFASNTEKGQTGERPAVITQMHTAHCRPALRSIAMDGA